MKQFIILDHFLNKRDVVETDVVPKVFDCIVPQKTTITFDLGINVEENDVVIIRDIETRKEEYLGIIDTKEKGKTVKLAMLPFISICDNDLNVETLDGTISVQLWIENQLKNNFVNTDDIYSKFNIVVRNNTNKSVIYKAVDDSQNLLDVLNEIYLNTGIYVDFSIGYEDGKVNKIFADIYNANEQPVKKIRYDNPQIIDEVSYKFSQYGNYSKASIYVEKSDKTFYLYLREDNTITTNPQDKHRIKKVKNKNVKLTAEFNTEQELAEQIVLLGQKTLLGDAFAYSIEFNVLRRAISDWEFRQRCDFKAEDRLFQSYITNITYLNDKEAKVTLGAYRYTLTDKFKALIRPKEEIGASMDGINVSTALGDTTYWFTQNENGELILNYPDGEEQPNFSVVNGNLIYTYNESERETPDFLVDNEGDLIYNY